jgi:UDP-2,3-diacylglucosamine pyrophosphatase LpxH
MSTIKLILSDLHLADGHPTLDCFGATQQAAFDGLLSSACSGSPLAIVGDVELIINGDCFDFLVTSPYDTQGVTDNAIATRKFERIITAHHSFFAALRRFVATEGRHLTFIIGNHDIELAFVEVQQRITREIAGVAEHPDIRFCLSRFYHPLPDVYIEHGNHYDFWNHSIEGIWDTQGQPLITHPTTISLSVGSRYFQHAAHPVSIAYPYFDHFEPSMNSTRQIALLCLLDPEIIIETGRRTMSMLSEPRPALPNLAPGEERVPPKLFEHAMRDFAAYHQDMVAHKLGWTAPRGHNNEQAVENAMTEFTMLHEALSLPLIEAVAAICTPTTYQMGESVATGMHDVLKHDPTLRYAIAGHTHMVRIDPLSSDTQATQSYLNTASWTTRLALPAPGEVTPELIEWLRKPDWQHIPLRDVTQFIFGLIEGERDENQTDRSPSNASLCVWEGGSQGSYHVLA